MGLQGPNLSTSLTTRSPHFARIKVERPSDSNTSSENIIPDELEDEEDKSIDKEYDYKLPAVISLYSKVNTSYSFCLLFQRLTKFNFVDF